MKEFCTKKFGRDDFENLVKEGKLEVTYNWQDKVMIPETFDYKKFSDSFLSRIGLLFKDLKDFVVSGRSSIQRLYSGSELKAHADQDTDPSLAFGVVAYLRKAPGGKQSFEEGKLPSIDDIRGSGSIKQISFDIISFARNLTAKDDKVRNTIKIRILKSRYTAFSK